MPKSRRKLVGQLTQSQYALLKDLTDEAGLDAQSLETWIGRSVAERLELAHAFIDAANMLAASGNPMIRRNAASRAYYGAYHAARAAVFAVRRRDESDHDKVAHAVDEVMGARGVIQTSLKELRQIRNEMDYSPYPGPDPTSEYDTGEFDTLVGSSIDRAGRLLADIERYLQERR